MHKVARRRQSGYRDCNEPDLTLRHAVASPTNAQHFLVCCRPSTLAFSALAVQLEVRFRAPFGRLPKVLNSSEDGHLKNMSTFEADEHLRG
jgi:hypothetical protein